jgi:ElaB/YqjD/DUF883 family membrane-anchored ribosome-binding protein
MGSALEDLANSPDPQPAKSGGSALESLANAPDQAPAEPHQSYYQRLKAFFAADPNNPGDPSYAQAHPSKSTEMPGSFEGHPENIGEYVPSSIGQLASGAVDIAHGDIAKGGHKLISGAVNAAAPVAALTAPAAVMAAPITTGLSIAGGVAGQKGAEAIADRAGATPDQKALAGDVGGIVGGGIPFVGKSAVKGVANLLDVPAALSKDTVSTLATVAHKEGLPPIQAETARDAAEELQQSFINRAKSKYQVVDKAVNGDLKPVQEKITTLKKAIRMQSNVNPDLADKYIDDLAAQQKTLQTLIQKAKASGVPDAEQLMAAGDADYAKSMAMQKVSGGIKTASGIARRGGHPDPTLMANQMDRLHNNKTLERALGPDGAKALLDTAKAGIAKAKTVSTVKKAALVVGSAAAGGATYETTKALSGH